MAFNLHFLIPIIAAGIVAGWFAGLVTRGRGLGFFGNVLLAMAGATASIYIFEKLGIHLADGFIYAAFAGFIGAFCTLAFIGWLRR